MKYNIRTIGSSALLQLAIFCSVWSYTQAQDPFDLRDHVDQSCKDGIDCNDPLDMISSDKRELSTVTSKEDMDRLCPNIKQHLECIDRKTKRCMSPELQLSFNVLYNGTIVVMTELCHNDTYQQEFLRYASCFKDLKKEEDCEATYSDALTAIQKSGRQPDAVYRICCSFQEYLECSKRTVGAVCGADAGEFNKRMLDTMAVNLKEQCQQYAVAPDECRAISLPSRTGGAADAARPLLWLLAVLAVAALAAPARSLRPVQSL